LPVSGGLKGKRDQAGPRVGVKGAQRQKGVWLQKGVQHMQSNLNVGHRLSTRSILHWEKLCINVHHNNDNNNKMSFWHEDCLYY